MTNPLMNRGIKLNYRNRSYSNNIVTLNGVMNKSILLIIITMIVSLISFTYLNSPIFILGGSLIGVGLSFMVYFKPEYAKYLAPLYAIVEGVVIGSLSYMFEYAYEGIVSQALFLTFFIFLVMIITYKYRIIKVTDKFKAIIISATLGIMLLYFVGIILSFLGIYIPLFGGGLIGIGFSVFVIIIASLNLLLDFDIIEKMIENKAEKYFEWYCAFALLVTLIWIYVEALRLLSKLRSE